MKKYELMVLPYAPDSLEPVISKETIGFHHGKHLAAYVDNLNKLLPGSGYEGMALEEIVRKAPAGAVFNNAGQILNHEMYFAQFKSAGEAVHGPEGALAAQIEKKWGSIETFKTEFEAKGVGLFGSGWVWLSADADGNLIITQEQGASNPVVKGLKPLDLRRLGACLLSGLPEPSCCSSLSTLADCGLEGDCCSV